MSDAIPTTKRAWIRKARKHEARARAAEKRAAARPEGHVIRTTETKAANLERKLAQYAREAAKETR